MKRNTKVFLGLVVAAVTAFGGYPAYVMAQSSSTNYQVQESYFGVGGNVNTTSPNYQARQSLGSLGVGDSSSDNYHATAGFDTPSEPFLEMYITGATVDFGTLEDNAPGIVAAQAGSCNCSFSVRSYLSSDYTVVTASTPPTNESNHTLNAKSTQGAPSTNTSIEEFGINLVDNTSPDVGADPVNDPDDTFADGTAATGYNIPNQFKYSIGDIIARSPSTPDKAGIGKTNYTITYMAKVASITPAGLYKMEHDVIAVPSF